MTDRGDIEKEIAEAKKEISQIENSLPTNCLLPAQMARIEELEDEIEELQSKLAAA